MRPPEAFQHPGHLDLAKGHRGRDPDHPGKARATALGDIANQRVQIVQQGRGARQKVLLRQASDPTLRVVR